MRQETDRLIAVGDVHGCIHALEALMLAIAPVSGDTVVFLGDLIDQGRDSAAVIDHILKLQKICRVELIEGNHEEMFRAARESESALRYWENCGGVQTLNSYRFGANLNDVPHDHWNLIESCKPWFETDDFIFTHANYLPDRMMEQQPEYQLRWALFVPEEIQPHTSGKTVVTGHTETQDSEILDLGCAICIDTACWRHGWLTALDCRSRKYWQASRWGVLREAAEPTHRGMLTQFKPPESLA